MINNTYMMFNLFLAHAEFFNIDDKLNENHLLKPIADIDIHTYELWLRTHSQPAFKCSLICFDLDQYGLHINSAVLIFFCLMFVFSQRDGKVV